MLAPPPAPADTGPRPTVRAINCPNCGGTVDLRVAGTTVSVICTHCGSTLDATTPDYQVIARANEALQQPEIKLGTRGVLGGTTWEAVGYVERTDGEIDWCEYLLFNPYEGYVFLIDDGRRFSLGRMLDHLPSGAWDGAQVVGDETFSRFGEPYPVKVTFVVGEFYWRVAIGDTVTETDFVKPGTMLACEDEDQERTWTRLDMFDWGVVEKAFGIPRRPREYSTPAPHEPNPWGARTKEALVIAFVAFLLLAITTSFGGGYAQVATANTEVPLDGPEKTIVLRDVNLPGGGNRVSVAAAAAGLDNAWVDIDYSLIDKKTQESVDSYGLAEFYEGQDSDGHWSEGSTNPSTTLSSIPGGRYDLTVTLQAHKWNSGSSSASPMPFPTPTPFSTIYGTYAPADAAPPAQMIPVTVAVHRGGSSADIFFLALLFIAVWPAMTVFKYVGFNSRRVASIS